MTLPLRSPHLSAHSPHAAPAPLHATLTQPPHQASTGQSGKPCCSAAPRVGQELRCGLQPAIFQVDSYFLLLAWQGCRQDWPWWGCGGGLGTRVVGRVGQGGSGVAGLVEQGGGPADDCCCKAE